ncbi:AMP-binding protein [Microbacterium sp. zg.B48]|uniref:AMP-binding protein n=1 Tax=Microbacterium sp. zg.B48 TaxID=2969408 RepID=UPI00214BC419|nr:AMP-binding protein [Microbacterium sp. zg.B48]MCR2763289.1 AMP-binding protein [Microbacterium sp. zg.B48]
MNTVPTTAVDGLRISARDLGNEHGILYYSTPETTSYRGYADLDERARRLGHALVQRGHGIGDTVVLGVSDALTVADTAFGAMYAGLAFVPAPVSGPAVAAGLVPTLARISAAAEASLLLVDAAVRDRLGDDIALFGMPVLVLEELLGEGDPDAWTPPPIDGDTIAYLLFTSGSTGDPKGVITTHRGVVETSRACVPLFGLDRDATLVGWAPMHHIMGLATQALFPAINGAKAVACATELFQRRPIFWLQLISKHRGTSSAAGNFAFALCTQLATDEQIAELDLRSLKTLFTASEPVRPETVRAFVKRFGPTGITEDAIAPLMGMTEAMLISGKSVTDALTIRRFDAAALESGRLVPSAGAGSVEWVSCGRWTDRTSVVIVDPDTLMPVAEGVVGEIWVSSPMVSPGYFRRPDATAETFGRTLPGDDRSYMRTGDLAAIVDGELYVTGRLKEMLIIRGRNLYPQDIEAAARALSPAVGIGAVFELAGHPSAVGLAFEASAEALAEAGETADSLAELVRQRLVPGVSLPSLAVAVVAEGTLPRTPTGKVRRQPTRAQLESGALATLHASGFKPIATPTL